jgi:cystathionine beta-lyase
MERILGGSWDEQRQRRTSIKWSLWGPEVLPVWVAEMDAAPCPAVEASPPRSAGETPVCRRAGMPALAAYAQDTWAGRWTPLAHGHRRRDDGIEAILGQVTRLERIVVSPPTYDSFFGFVIRWSAPT